MNKMKQCCSPKCTVLSQQGGTMSRAITKFRFLVKCIHFNHQNIATINNLVTSISSVSTNRCHKPDWNKKNSHTCYCRKIRSKYMLVRKGEHFSEKQLYSEIFLEILKILTIQYYSLEYMSSKNFLEFLSFAN